MAFSFFYSLPAVNALLRIAFTVQECDATMTHSSNTDGLITILLLILAEENQFRKVLIVPR